VLSRPRRDLSLGCRAHSHAGYFRGGGSWTLTAVFLASTTGQKKGISYEPT
jgi:hypothetical protein